MFDLVLILIQHIFCYLNYLTHVLLNYVLDLLVYVLEENEFLEVFKTII